MAGVLGIVQTGNPYVPLVPEQPQEQVDFILSDAKINMVLVDAPLLVPGGLWENRKQAVSLMAAIQSNKVNLDWTVT